MSTKENITNMFVPFVDLKKQYRSIKKEVDKAIQEVILNSHFIQGDQVKQFEQEFAQYLGVNFCAGVNSGTDALILGLRGLSLEPSDEVIVPVNTFIATALAVSENGLKPVFADIDNNDCGISLGDLKCKITNRTRAVILVHLYGQPDKIYEVQDILKKLRQKIYLVEDACQAHGATYKGKKVGNFGIFAAFSFYPGKNLGAYGDAGAIVTNEKKLADKFKLLREYGQKKKYYHEVAGVNSRLDTLQAAVLRVKLKYLDKWNSRRRMWAAKYTELLRKQSPFVDVPKEFPHRKSIYHLYVIRVKKRNKLLQFLQDHQVQSLIHYPFPLHLQKAFKRLGYRKGAFPVAERVGQQILSLPMFSELQNKQIKYIVNLVSKFYEEN